jgi:DNA-binding IclR family transcriptional regulator
MCNHPALLPEQLGVIRMEFIAEIRRRHFVGGESVSAIARDLQLSRPTVRKALKALAEPGYKRQRQPAPKLGEFTAQLAQWLDVESRLPKRQRRTARRLFEGLQARATGVLTTRCSAL